MLGYGAEALRMEPPKMAKQHGAITTILQQALASPEGRRRIAEAEALMVDDCERYRSFNTERAVQVYTAAIDDVVWAWMKRSQFKRIFYREYRRSGLKWTYAKKLVAEFKTGQGRFRLIKDQRPQRTFLIPAAGPLGRPLGRGAIIGLLVAPALGAAIGVWLALTSGVTVIVTAIILASTVGIWLALMA
jgi:hypothetical protein